jgi:S1-C subfamily serine protease
VLAFAWAAGSASTALAEESSGPVFTYEADVARVALGWRNRIFLVVANGGPRCVPIDRVAREPSALFSKRRVGCAVYLGERRLLLTTASVVRGSREIEVFMEGGERAIARIVGTDPALDVALLETVEDLPRTEDLPDLEIVHDSTAGAECLVLGNAYGRSFSAVLGIVGEPLEIMHFGLPVRLLRVNAAFFPGDSGGAVLDANGRFLGLVTAISHPSRHDLGRSAQGSLAPEDGPGPLAGTIGFALPARDADRAWRELLEFGRVRRGYLGVSISLGAKDDAGARILQVFPGSPAARAGILPGDLVTGFGRSMISGPRELRSLVASCAPGARLDLQYMRGQIEHLTTVELGESVEAPESSDAEFPGGPEKRRFQEPLPLSPTTPLPVTSSPR